MAEPVATDGLARADADASMGASKPEELKARKEEKRKEKQAMKAAKIAKALAKQEKKKQQAGEGERREKGVSKQIRLKREFVHEIKLGEKKDLSLNPLTSESSYDPPAVEAAWYAWWECMGFFDPDRRDEFRRPSPSSSEVFSMVIPPPNVTGMLHIGHALANSVQDALVRYHRMMGRRVLWVPGTDHAGIATQSTVEKRLYKEKGLTRHELGRERFLEYVHEWKNKYAGQIVHQLRRLGSSLDWSRECFTMDARLSRAVTEAFVLLYNRGKITRRTRLINWSCQLQTVVSDIETESIQVSPMMKMSVPGYDPSKRYQFGAIWNVAYKLVDSEDELVVSTTRPETILGDTALAVHPDDERYKRFVGRRVAHPFIPSRRMSVVADSTLVDMEFGTGVVKITPAHDRNDYSCGERHGLEVINILNTDGTINENGGPFKGLKRYDAREAVVARLKEMNLLREVLPHEYLLQICSRSGDVIEPMIMPQWWVRCADMSKTALDAVESGELEIVPSIHVPVWKSWLRNCQDWCVSRQLWWGHRVPAWLVTLKGQGPTDSADEEAWVVARDEREAAELAERRWPGQVERLEQDPDVLDTWFSSSLFPFSVFGWPNHGSNARDARDFETFFPNTVLETGHDILFFWVARMVMMSLELHNRLPFKKVLLHAIVRDAHGRKMSKSLGNVIDPLEVIEGISKEALIENLHKGNLHPSEVARATQVIENDFPNGIEECGTDALRFALCNYTSQYRDINMDIMRVRGYRNFCNKIWNAVKLTLMILGELPGPGAASATNEDKKRLSAFVPCTLESLASRVSPSGGGVGGVVDQWILSRLDNAISGCHAAYAQDDLSTATTVIYNFWLYEYCDYYLEYAKSVAFAANPDPTSLEMVRQSAFVCAEEGLRLLHPFMPYLSEDLWQRLPRRPELEGVPSICVAPYPVAVDGRRNAEVEKAVGTAQEVIRAVRSIRFNYHIHRRQSPELLVHVHTQEHMELYATYRDFIRVLTCSSAVKIELGGEVPARCAVAVPNETCEVYLFIRDVVDAAQELKRLTEKAGQLGQKREEMLKRMGSAEYQRVPDRVRAEEAKKLETLESELANLDVAKMNFSKLV
ncbi:probable valine--tRNA ligase, cytoplasmic [Schistocerca gregaria]|uniref:probable valine--tRNA ligase, cytoplasmic n=1 Tax=Schistocerca gregaria TaxID=7010 RepID=UPI00211E5DEA|nr:probable valine--tRNA ligase, cytoplasmic [Schistocerca gregaria]